MFHFFVLMPYLNIMLFVFALQKEASQNALISNNMNLDSAIRKYLLASYNSKLLMFHFFIDASFK